MTVLKKIALAAAILAAPMAATAASVDVPSMYQNPR